MKILIIGASGNGTTTLAGEIAKNSAFTHLDADNYYWKKTEVPFTEKESLQDRNDHLKSDLSKVENAVVSGSLISWGHEWKSYFDLVVFIYLPNAIRMQRLRQREQQRYGEKLITDDLTRRNSEAFLTWAEQYDDPDFTGRSFKIQEQWLREVSGTVIWLEGELELEEKVEEVFNHINQ
ncbi:AAA family ATPase [Fulvivirga ligni]|uniref:AAA family ATPase n=1 Tax=Fulvivirga ligni TaxID=2904246 RepID=UPI001F26A14C|nr:AAA family ATPase [Fulvivirga ligni]UII24294.1 AAA family ATPase [Fulvivirga ligni]